MANDLSFYAFPSSFNGGVNVVLLNIRTSSGASIVYGAGPGDGPEVGVYGEV